MNTEEVMRTCDSCKESVSIDARKCPHCGEGQFTSRMVIGVMTVLGILGLPFSYVALPLAISYGVPNGFVDGLGTGIVWAIGLLGPIFLLIALGSYLQRREAIQEHVPE